MVSGKMTPVLSYHSSIKRLRQSHLVFLGLTAVCLLVGLFVLKEPVSNLASYKKPNVETQPSVASASAAIANPTSTPTPQPTLSPTPTPKPATKIIFGIGSQAGPAMDFRLVKEAPVHKLSSWYNGPSDLEWMRVQKRGSPRRP